MSAGPADLGGSAPPPECPAPPEAERSALETGEAPPIRWTPEAEARLARAPAFLRGMVRRLAERRARAEGVGVITPELMTRYKTEMMGLGTGGETTGAALSWTVEAEGLLAAVPEFMRPMTRRICEELAREQGIGEVTATLILEAEGQAQAEAASEPVAWAPDAEAALLGRLGRTPAMMADFVLRMFKRDVELEARRSGVSRIDRAALEVLWARGGVEPVEWTEEAWARLLTAPEFVREGIRKAAERRARALGVTRITSPLLTTFRNQAMMRAVRRIRELGFSELTFEAFDAARERMRIVSLNPDAHERLDTIRRYFDEERAGRRGDTLGEDLMRRFRAYLRDPAAHPLEVPGPGEPRDPRVAEPEGGQGS